MEGRFKAPLLFLLYGLTACPFGSGIAFLDEQFYNFDLEVSLYHYLSVFGRTAYSTFAFKQLA